MKSPNLNALGRINSTSALRSYMKRSSVECRRSSVEGRRSKVEGRGSNSKSAIPVGRCVILNSTTTYYGRLTADNGRFYRRATLSPNDDPRTDGENVR